MDNEDNKKSMMDIEYVPIYQKRLGDMLTYAKGKQSMAEFAKKCGFNPITFSRIVNGSIKKPLSQEEIRRIAENSERPTEVVFIDLMRANGMVPKDDNTPMRQESQKRWNEGRLRSETIQNAIMRDLFDRGYTISPVFNTPLKETDPILQKSRFFLSHHVNYALSVQGCEITYWNFMINNFTGKEFANDPDKYAKEIRSETRDIMLFNNEIFLRDAWEPEAFENSRFSFAFINKELFESFFELIKDVKFNNSFSIILLDLDKTRIDIDERRVVEERLLPRRDGKEEISLF